LPSACRNLERKDLRMDPVWIAIAFACGFLARQIDLPPLVGFLAAGFFLQAMGVAGGEALQLIADLGVTLLLFTIGLKLDLRSLARLEVWAGASLHLVVTVVLFGLGLFALGLTGLPLVGGIDPRLALLLAFALSFSSTVFAVKILEEKGEMNSTHGRTAIGILIMQDIFAVLFLTFSTGKLPSLWALAVPLALWMLRPVFKKLLNRCGHGELMILFGLFLALIVGAAGFELVNLKADLGALVLGLLVADHPKAGELSKALLGFKDLFLVGFFLSIGLSGAPSWQALGLALLLTFVMPLKSALFFVLLTRFRLRARSSLLSSLSLANYSEFGLIVGALAAEQGWIDPQWLTVIALALSLTFVLAAPLNAAGNRLYLRFHDALGRFETASRHPDDQPVDPGEATAAIFGMGRIGTGAYNFLENHSEEKLIGVDFDKSVVEAHRAAGRNVIFGDPSDPDFWIRANIGSKTGQVRLLLLAIPNHKANLTAAQMLLEGGFKGKIATIAQYEDQVAAFKDIGVHTAFNFFGEAGAGLAEHALAAIEPPRQNRLEPKA
jgi:glutathione-regulated potassium-efflux system ancillary protein KefC